MSKPNIRSLGEPYNYLKDPDLRAKETGDAQLVVKDALFSGATFQYVTWKNIRFLNCDFAGAYEIKLTAMENCSFENCKIVGIHDFGSMNKVRFYKCLSGGSSNWGGQDAKNVVFEECQFLGDTADRNHQGAIGTYGDATFINCKAKWFGISAHTAAVFRDCEFESVAYHPSSQIASGAHVVIEGCKLRGTFDMAPSALQSLIIRDTQIDVLDLTGASVKGDVVMEKIKASSLKMGIQEGAQSLRLKDSWITGDGERVCAIYAGAFKHVLVEDVRFGGSVNEVAGIGGGYRPDDASPQPVLTQSITFRRVKAPMLRSARLNAAAFTVEDCEIERANFGQGRIDTLTFTRNTFSFTLDLSQTRVKEFKQSGGTDLRKLDGFKAEGSNIKLPH
ncbi:Pentapeptide repeats (9 copies) [Xylophilus ampelinus]|nr:hypothetical protein [Variovorax sp.]VTY21058.1 Pentapeptide repeats (9 copies) [Xylophilus ampelinus]